MPSCIVSHLVVVCCLVRLATVVRSHQHDSTRQIDQVQPVPCDNWSSSELVTTGSPIQNRRWIAPAAAAAELTGAGSPKALPSIADPTPSPSILAAPQASAGDKVQAVQRQLASAHDPSYSAVTVPDLRLKAACEMVVTHSRHDWSFWSNWDSRSKWDCAYSGRNRALVGIRSKHNNHREDRVWRYKCGAIMSGFVLKSCKWSSYTNWDATWEAYAGQYKVVVGIDSYHDNHREDRIFSFRYCFIAPQDGRSYSWSFGGHRDYGLTSWDSEWSYEFGSTEFLYHIWSKHSNHKEDRIFHFTTVTATAALSEECVESPAGWRSRNWYTCHDYVRYSWCTSSGGYGSGWWPDDDTFDSWARDGHSAIEACCECGGGVECSARRRARRLLVPQVAGADVEHLDIPQATNASNSPKPTTVEDHDTSTGITFLAIITTIKAYSASMLAVITMVALCVLFALALRRGRATRIGSLKGGDANAECMESQACGTRLASTPSEPSA